MNRPRGLCWSCYYAPGAKEEFPSTSKYTPHSALLDEPTMAELDAMIAEQLPTMPANDEEPPATAAEAEARWSRAERKHSKAAGPRPGDLWETWAGIDHSRVGCEFHPDTEPAAIAAAQRQAVREALALEPGATVARLSELTVLPVWNVKRRLGELTGANS